MAEDEAVEVLLTIYDRNLGQRFVFQNKPWTPESLSHKTEMKISNLCKNKAFSPLTLCIHYQTLKE